MEHIIKQRDRKPLAICRESVDPHVC